MKAYLSYSYDINLHIQKQCHCTLFIIEIRTFLPYRRELATGEGFDRMRNDPENAATVKGEMSTEREKGGRRAFFAVAMAVGTD